MTVLIVCLVLAVTVAALVAVLAASARPGASGRVHREVQRRAPGVLLEDDPEWAPQLFGSAERDRRARDAIAHAEARLTSSLTSAPHKLAQRVSRRRRRAPAPPS